MKPMTLGSLFDGSGGFTLGALLNGIIPLWASEIEPFPIRVTSKRLPFVKHYGDIRNINGAAIEPVDIISFGSPCTNLSIAGKREGLEGAQSSLFFHAIRIIREMRKATNGRYPRFIVWENVPGAYSSGKGEDFWQVLQAIVHTKDETADVPLPEKRKWLSAGEIVADDYSVAWRTIDAQYWGVPQRRRRCYLVADFASECAGKILFEFESLSGYTPQGFSPWQGAAPGAEGGAGTASAGGEIILSLYENHQHDSRYRGPMDVAQTVSAMFGTGGNNQPFVVASPPDETERPISAAIPINTQVAMRHRALGEGTGLGIGKDGDPAYTLQAAHAHAVAVSPPAGDVRMVCPVLNARSKNLESSDNLAYCLVCAGYKGQQCVYDPLVPQTLKIRSGCEGGGKGALVQKNKSATLGCNNDQTLFVPFGKGTRPHNKEEGQVWEQKETANTLNTFDVGESRCNEVAVRAYGIGAVNSLGMLSDNPHAGYYEADTSRTLDQSGGNPACNQGGIAVVEESAIKKEPVAYDCRNHSASDVSGTLQAKSNGGQSLNYINPVFETYQTVTGPLMANSHPGSYCGQDAFSDMFVATSYLVRRLTPDECALLQGFPSWWCADLGTPDPTEEEITLWQDVFETHLDECQRLVAGEVTAEEFIENVARVMD